MLNVFWKQKSIINKTNLKISIFLTCLTCLTCLSCFKAYHKPELATQEEYRFPRSDEPWRLISNQPFDIPAYLGNRWFGIRLAANGLGVDEKTKPLPCFYLQKDVLCKVPNIAQVLFWADGEILTPSKTSSYLSVLDMRSGLFTVQWKQRLKNDKDVLVKIENVCNPIQPEIAQRVLITANKPIEVRFWNGFKGMEYSIKWSKNSTTENYEGRIKLVPVSEGEKKALTQDFLYLIRECSFSRGVFHAEKTPDGILSHSEEPVKELVFESVTRLSETRLSEKSAFFEEVYARAKEWWGKRWMTDIEIEGSPEDQKAVRTFMFYLYMNANEKLPPMGLSSEKYRGHRFWDAEAWMLPVYVWIFPDSAKKATHWRLNAIRKSHAVPWEHGAGGQDLTPPEFKNALHVSGWVWWWMERAKAFGFLEEEECFYVCSVVGEQFLRHAVHSDYKTEIRSVRGPDETRERNNDLVTNLLAKSIWNELSEDERVPLKKRQLYRQYSTTIKIPTLANGIPATYDNDHLRSYQQTSALLALFPLEGNFSRAMQNRMFDLYKNKIIPIGPAMSDSIHATIAARLNRPEEAYAFWKASWKPFLREPNALFSERKNTNETYFLTGAAGCLQTVIYGFLGIRLEKGKGETDPLSKVLANGYRISIEPCLPASWESITFHNVPISGRYVTIRASRKGVEIHETEGKSKK